MEPMNVFGCDGWQGAIAMHVFGDLAPDEESGLLAHLEGCSNCQAIATEMTAIYDVLGHVDPRSVAPTAAVPPELAQKVLWDLHHTALRERRLRRSRAGALAGGGLVAAMLILVTIFAGKSVPPTPVARTLSLRGVSQASASAVLSERPWGTSIVLHERGLPGDQVYTVSMRTAQGTWWIAGTYRSVSDKTVDATMACAVPLRQITGVRVSNVSGVTMLSTYSDASRAGRA